MSDLQLHPQLRAAAIPEVLARSGRVHIPDLLQAESAQAIHRALSASKDWQLSLNSGRREKSATLERSLQRVLKKGETWTSDRACHGRFDKIRLHPRVAVLLAIPVMLAACSAER